MKYLIKCKTIKVLSIWAKFWNKNKQTNKKQENKTKQKPKQLHRMDKQIRFVSQSNLLIAINHNISSLKAVSVLLGLNGLIGGRQMASGGPHNRCIRYTVSKGSIKYQSHIFGLANSEKGVILYPRRKIHNRQRIHPCKRILVPEACI